MTIGITMQQLIENANKEHDALTTFSRRDYAVADPELQKLLLRTPVESNSHMWKTNQEHRNAIMGSPWGKAFSQWAQHNIGQDKLPGEIEFDSMVVKPLTPELIGRDLIPIKPVTKPEGQFPVFTAIGKSVKTARGQDSYRSGTGKMLYKKWKLQNSWNTSDNVDLDFLEDIMDGEIQEYWGELYRAHRALVSQNFINEIAYTGAAGSGKQFSTDAAHTWTDDSGNSHNSGIEIASTAASMDALIDAITAARKKNWAPDSMLLTWTMVASFLKADEFQQEDYFKEFANFNNATISNLMGLTMYITNQIPTAGDTKIWMWLKDRYIQATMRRDELITNLQDDGTLSQGLSISSRYGFYAKDGSVAIRIGT